MRKGKKMNNTPASLRTHIAFFGARNAGKSSLVNAVTAQKISVVSDVAGTTTDPVKKSMELLPLGPVLIIDTPGFDDTGKLGEKRVERTKEILRQTDAAVLVVDSTRGIAECDKELISLFKKNKIPYITVGTKTDIADNKNNGCCDISVSSVTGEGINEFKERLSKIIGVESEPKLISDILSPLDYVILVTPIDSAAPKGRLIMPQQLVLRDILDHGAIPVVTRETELKEALCGLAKPPALVITDSQVFKKVNKIIPGDMPLTSFSIIMARFKGFLKTAVNGAAMIDKLKDGDTVLISEGCTHHRQCDDIGTVKIPRLLKKYTEKELKIETTSGGEFPKDLSKYTLIIHCGGCMLNGKEMTSRVRYAEEQGIPLTNYGTALAKMNGILERSIEPIKDRLCQVYE